ncbi:MAG: UDP-glucose dehydrogenase family protein [bacterium]
MVGTGYVGLTTAVALAYLGHRVVGVDKDLNKLELLRNHKVPIHEPGLDMVLKKASANVSFTNETSSVVADAEVIIIAVGTPPKKNGEADTHYVEQAAREISLGLRAGRSYTLVVKSTVPIGSNRRVAHVVKQVLGERGVKAKVSIASSPEFLREGNALRDMFYPDRIVVGAEEVEAVDTLRCMYQPILEQTFTPPTAFPRPEGYSLPPLVTTDPTSAEMIKYAANAFLATKISFINEIAGLCDKVGADVTEVSRGIGLDSRIGPRFLSAGLGWGGSCFPKDTAALLAVAAEYGYSMPIIQAAREVNYRQRQIIVEKLQAALKVIRGRTIGVLGLAFKPNTDDVREAPAIDLIRMLAERGAHVRAHDPVAILNARKAILGVEVDFKEDPYRLATGADALVLATDWNEYRTLDLTKLAQLMSNRVLVDGRNIYSPDAARAAGFTYLGVGR